MSEVEPLVCEFEKLSKGTKLEVATLFSGKMKTLEKDLMITRTYGWLKHLVIENEELQKESHMLKKDLKDRQIRTWKI